MESTSKDAERAYDESPLPKDGYIVSENELSSSVNARTPRSITGSYRSIFRTASQNDSYERRLSRIFSFNSTAVSYTSSKSLTSNVPSLSMDSEYGGELTTRGQSILHMNKAVEKRVFIGDNHSISRGNIIIAKDMAFVASIPLSHNEVGCYFKGYRLKKKYGIYWVDQQFGPVIIYQLKKNSISECMQFEDVDYQQHLKIQSTLNSHKKKHVISMYHLLEMENCILSIEQMVNGDLEQYKEWIRSHGFVQEVFKQVIEAYEDLLSIGYYHNSLSLECFSVIIESLHDQFHLTVCLTDYQNAIAINPHEETLVFGDCYSSKPYYAAPETYNDSFDAGEADIWSLGIILYSLLLEEPPFDIANSSDPAFNAFQTEGFACIKSELCLASVNPKAIDLLERVLVINPQERADFSFIQHHPYLL